MQIRVKILRALTNSSLVFQVFVSYNIPEDDILTPLVIEKLVAEIKSHPDKF